eukprot:Blabericola_migrator_1__10314@NODE_57_length_15939_cov_84_297253_g52_i0_p5_GENE_NODE_57_length_15939_cov_84_297253_g52_i0NODE_57_length_15939_cov_84_297253_g52_i0_p5_ORF_typecomplete_len264_score39_08TFIIF_beta/PF02270_15/5_8e03TFIIF_beta/PF02270_15/0_00019DUF2019/PF09450_10/0_12_NODE_57_length_15939_cov_84_297253_g52_i01061311404
MNLTSHLLPRPAPILNPLSYLPTAALIPPDTNVADAAVQQSKRLVIQDENLALLRVPQSVADKWLEVPEGTVVGIAVGPTAKRIMLPNKELGLMLDVLDLAPQSEVPPPESGSRVVLDDRRIRGTVRDVKVYKPANLKRVRSLLQSNVKQPKPQLRLLNASESCELQRNLRAGSDGAATNLFKYLTPAKEGGEVVMQQKSLGEIQQALFHLFERNEGRVTLQAALSHVGGSKTQAKKTLDMIAEPVEKQGRRLTYQLRPQYRR